MRPANKCLRLLGLKRIVPNMTITQLKTGFIYLLPFLMIWLRTYVLHLFSINKMAF